MRHTGSILPRISGKRTKDGTLLIAPGVFAKDLRELVLIFVAFGFGALAVFLGLSSHRVNARAISIAASTFFMLVGSLRHYLTRRRLRRVALLIHPFPIRLGDDVSIKFRARMRTADPITDFTAQLECAEEVVIGTGKSRREKRSTLFAIDLPSEKQELEQQWTVHVPAELPPSLAVPNNIVRWRVTANITTANLVVPATVDLLVLPEVS
jgi:hypothetical protein